jgi:hypothetical protein
MPQLKDRGQIHCVLVGEPGYPPNSGREPVDTRRIVDACHVEGCSEAATQLHGLPKAPILTCDAHAEAVMLALLEGIA